MASTNGTTYVNKNQSNNSTSSPNTPNYKSTFKYCSDFDKKVLVLNFKKRGWLETKFEDLSWNFYW